MRHPFDYVYLVNALVVAHPASLAHKAAQVEQFPRRKPWHSVLTVSDDSSKGSILDTVSPGSAKPALGQAPEVAFEIRHFLYAVRRSAASFSVLFSEIHTTS